MDLETIAQYWQQLNHNYLIQEVARIQTRLYEKIGNTEEPILEVKDLGLEEAELLEIIPSFAIEEICDRFGLTPFEKDILLLCAGMELDRGWGLLCGQAQGSDITNYPTFSLALSSLDYAHWDAITPNSALRHWRLIELKDNSNSLTTKELVIDEQILHYLLGNKHLDERLAGLLELVTDTPSLVPSHQNIVDKLVQIWLQPEEVPIIHLYGQDIASKKAIATAIIEELQLNLYTISAEILPSDTGQLYLLKCLLEREWLLNQSTFFLDCDYWENSDRSKDILVSLLLDNLRCPLIISSQERRRERHKSLIAVEVKKPTTQEQRLLWSESLAEIIPESNGQIDTLVSYFNLNSTAIETVCLQVKSVENNGDNSHDINHDLWQMCRTQARPHLEQLSQNLNL